MGLVSSMMRFAFIDPKKAKKKLGYRRMQSYLLNASGDLSSPCEDFYSFSCRSELPSLRAAGADSQFELASLNIQRRLEGESRGPRYCRFERLKGRGGQEEEKRPFEVRSRKQELFSFETYSGM